MSITFNEIQKTRIPGVYVELNTKLAQRGLPDTDAKVVLIGQKTSSGTLAVATLQQVLDDAEVETYAGSGSMLHRMALAALTANNKMAGLYILAVADASGSTAASGSFAFTASSLKAGTLTVYIGDDTFQVGLTGTETSVEVATKVKLEIDARAELPVTATISSATVTLTARNKGTLGTDIHLGTTYTKTGLTVVTTAMSGGATDPSIQAALDAIASADVDVLVVPYQDSTSWGYVTAHLNARSDGIEQRGAVAIGGLDASVSTATSLATTLNSGRVSIALLEGTRSWGPEIAAAYAAVIAGESDLARPLDGVEMLGVHAPDVGYRFTRAELTTLLAGGIAPLIVKATEKVAVCRSITTYLTDSNAIADDALLDLQTIRVLDYSRRAYRERFMDKFAQKKIADQAHTQNTVDVTIIKAEALALAKELEAIDYWEQVDDLSELMVVERNSSDATRVDIYVPVNVVNGLHVLPTQIHLYSL